MPGKASDLIINSCEPPRALFGIELRAMEEQPVLLDAETSLQTLKGDLG